MFLLIIIAAFLVFIIIRSIQEAKNKKKLIKEEILENWGKIPQEEYTDLKMKAIRKYYLSQIEPDKDIDDITYGDLEFDKIFYMINQTGSAAGEEYLYALLRKPLHEEKELKRRNRLIRFFSKEPDIRLKLQVILHSIGKLNQVSVYEYINRTEKMENINKIPHIIMGAGFFLSLCAIFIVPQAGIIAVIVFLILNILSYYKIKARIQGYFTVLQYILKLLSAAEEIQKMNIKDLSEYTECFSEALKIFASFRKGAWLVISGTNMGGDLMDMILDYLRMLFHIDLIRFSSMLKTVQDNREILNRLYESTGFLDSMIAAASFRELLPYYKEPVLKDGGANYLIGEELYHPLLKKPVSNTISVTSSVLLTGSNASGKSTFLKTVALNAILSQTIFTSISKRYEASYFRIFSSMSLRDNIANEDSYFMVEIKSLKRILDQKTGKVPVLCFVDEVLRGTNTLERIAASTEILKTLSEGNVICFAATHDIELTHILEKIFKNYHFSERVGEDSILFDYHLYEGRSATRNAIKLLKMIGYSDSIIARANEAASNFLSEGKWRAVEKV